MLPRLFILALCAMPALWDDSCRITVRPLWRLYANRHLVVDGTHAGDIEVARCTNGERVQVLQITSDEALAFSATFHVDDLNFDGYLDFSVVAFYAGSTGDIRSYWVYDPGSGRFVENEFTHELRCGAAAVTSKNGGPCMFAAFIDFDPAKHEIGRKYFGGAMGGCPNTGEGKGERYRVVNNRLLLIHTQDFESIYQRGSFQYCAVTISDLVGGTMLVTEVRRYNRQGRLVK